MAHAAALAHGGARALAPRADGAAAPAARRRPAVPPPVPRLPRVASAGALVRRRAHTLQVNIHLPHFFLLRRTILTLRHKDPVISPATFSGIQRTLLLRQK